MTVTWQKYQNEKNDFLKKHGEYAENTRIVNGVSFMRYTFEDGCWWEESLRKETCVCEFEINKASCKATVELAKVEFYSTECVDSKFAYDQW